MRPFLILVLTAIAAWAACALTMAIADSLVSTESALVIHALFTLVWFALAAGWYRRRHAWPGPKAIALTNLATVVVLDVVVVAGLVLNSFEMFDSVMGTWLPFALVLVGSWAAARVVVTAGLVGGTSARAIQSFLSGRTLAFVGLSSNPRDFSHVIRSEFERRGYRIVPVNPRAPMVAGQTCYPSISDLPEDLEVDGAFVMVPPTAASEVVRDCVDAGVTNVWLHRGVGGGAVSNEAVTLAMTHGIEVVPGQCPLMFLPNPTRTHRAHAWVKKAAGTYPV